MESKYEVTEPLSELTTKNGADKREDPEAVPVEDKREAAKKLDSSADAAAQGPSAEALRAAAAQSTPCGCDQ